ncbi:MAG: flavodoxin [Tenuifilaceae bacterium]|jgi:flavodoxin I|uniref:flavodoxin n=1 Tax=Perlabentimonas gracilis TaxID=2715279 RepID=UPI00140B7AAD|nr:flavodoxin [Perlabentimonas gracilis]MDX9769594.1 flavodoxin [Tenuifilaceae bacterium]NHB67068.1 flavodoxin [Perlabentimonas gracilis]
MKKKVGIFYGPTGGKTENVAQRLQQAFGQDNADLIPIKSSKASDLDKYENLILGCSTIGKETWDADRTKEDWDLFRPEIEKINYAGKTFALFGLGDSVTYAANFVDAMGVIANIMLAKGAKIVGQVPTSQYNFTDSEAVIDNQFIGLPIDEDFEPDLTDQRIASWAEELKRLFA